MSEYRKVVFIFLLIVAITNCFVKDSFSENTNDGKFIRVDGTNLEYYIEPVSTEWIVKHRHTYECGTRKVPVNAQFKEDVSVDITRAVAEQISAELGLGGYGSIGVQRTETFQETFGITYGLTVGWGDLITLERCFKTLVNFHVKVEKTKYVIRRKIWGWPDYNGSFRVERIKDHKWEKIREYSPGCDREVTNHVESVTDDNGNSVKIRFRYPNSEETFIVPLLWDPHNNDVINPRKLLPNRARSMPNR